MFKLGGKKLKKKFLIDFFKKHFPGFLSLIPFTILVITLFYELWKIERPAACILLPYVIWLGYDLIWTYHLWRLNE